MEQKTVVMIEVPRLNLAYNENFNPEDVTDFVGKVINAFTHSQRFNLNGSTVRIPGLSGSADDKVRTHAALKEVVEAVFAGFDLEEEAPADSLAGKVCQSLKDKGYAFNLFSKAAAKEAVDIWLRAKRTKIREHVLDTRKANTEKLAGIEISRNNCKELSDGIKADIKSIMDSRKSLR